MIRALLCLLIGSGVLLWVACGPESTTAGASSEGADSLQPDSGLAGDSMADSGMVSRGLSLGVGEELDFEQRFPMLYDLLKEQPDDLAVVADYAEKVLTGERIASEDDIIDLMEMRSSQIIPILEPYLDNLDGEKWFEHANAYENELNQLGITQTAAEGTYTGLAQAEMLTQALRTNASTGLRTYMDFYNAEARTRSGEYPFNDMDPYFRMLVEGEQLMEDASAQRYAARVEEDFRRALNVITDIHRVQYESHEAFLVGGIHRDMYPFMTETESHKAFLANHPDSKYHGVVKRILENPSTMTERPENMYLIVTDWAASLNEADDKVFRYLNNQQDVPHHLEVRRGDGTDQYALTYRFFEDEAQANQALETCRAAGMDAELIFVSVKGDKLYQIGI